uniref:Mitochondrial-processing peptidase subunit beta n=1 Tax=Steinernema glaseri TaxID=37863 RepID=A0A1I7ZDC1_9BILA
MALRFISGSANSGPMRAAVRSFSAAAREVLQNAPESEVSTLKNGLRVASQPTASGTATVGVWIDSGSRYENDGNNGVATFLEHMIYKGTGKRTQAQLESELGKIGASLNSFTSREHTAYYAQCPTSEVEKTVDILADVLRNSKFDDAAIEAERNVLLRKMQEAEENIQEVVFDNMHAAAFQGTPLARSPLGTTEAIKEITRRDITEFAEDHYKPVRMVISGAGGVSHEQLTQLAEKYFGDLPNEYERKVPTVGGIRFTGSEYRYRNDNIPHMYGALAVEGVGLGHPDSLPLQVASTLVGQWDVTHAASTNAPSRLAQKVSTDPELFSYESFSLNYKDTGLFGIYFVLAGSALEDATTIVRRFQREWKHLTSGVTDVEVDRAKAQLKTILFRSMEGTTAKADSNARQVLYSGKLKTGSELIQEIDRIDAAAVREAMSRNVYDRDIVCAGVGRTEAWPNYSHLRYGMSWWRL